MPIFTIEGVVGAGKTSLLDALKDAKFASQHVIVYEPVDAWTNTRLDGPGTPSIFEKYYADKQRNGFMFQMFALQTRIQCLLEAYNKNPNAIIICERSHISDCEIFARMMKELNIISSDEFYVYKQWYNMCAKYLFKDFAGAIYIKTNPSKCIDRIMQRARSGEEHISFDYIRRLHELHNMWVNFTDLPVCMIDGNIENADISYALETQKVVEFCNKFVA